MKNSTTFEIAYTGSEVNGMMNVKELAPALLAIGELLENSNRVIGNPQVEIKTVVNSNFEVGSFHIKFDLICYLMDAADLFIDLVNIQGLPETILKSIGLLSGSYGLIQLIKNIKGRPIKGATILDNGKVRLQIQGANGEFDYIEVTENTMRLYKNRAIRDKLPEFIKPIKSKGIDSVEVKEGKKVIDNITKQEIDYFEPPIDLEGNSNDIKLVISSRRALVNIEDVPLNQPTLKWKLSEGDSKFWASLKDSEFLDKIDRRVESFKKGDILEIDLDTTNKMLGNTKIQSDYTITKIHNHIQPSQEITLFPDNK